MSATLIAASPSDDDADQVVDRALCRCGELARVIVHADTESCWCAIVCACGAFVPAGAQEGVAR